jgi:Ca-activated chloride channel family protein
MKTELMVETHPQPTGDVIVRALLRIAGEAPKSDGRVPLNLSLVLDRSGSMSGEPLEAVKKAAAGLIKRLYPEDVVSVVAFDDQVETMANPGTADDQAGLLDALSRIETRGMTNLSGGWLQGRALVQEYLNREGVNRVILLTDGMANEGITDTPTLTQLCRTARESGVITTTVGVGPGYSEDLLREMADAGSGSSYYIESLDQSVGVFEEELEGLLSIAAQNLTVRIRPLQGAAVATVHHSYPAVDEGNDVLRLSVGDLYAREPREVLTDVLVPVEALAGQEGDVALDVVELVVEADVWEEDGSMERRTVTLPVTFRPAEGAVAHPEVTRVFTLLEAARVRREAMERGDRGDVGGAVQTLRENVVLFKNANLDDEALAEEIRDLEALAETLEHQNAMSHEDRKYMEMKSRMYSRSQRSSGDRVRRGE